MEWLKALIAVAVISGVVSEGLETAPSQLTWLWKRPWLLFKSVIAVLVVVPSVTLLVVGALDLPRSVEIALILLSIAPAPPLLMRAAHRAGGDRAYAASLQVTLGLLAVLSLPGTLALLSMLFHAKAYVEPREVGWVIARFLLIPLTLSMLFRRWKPEQAAKWADPLAKLSLGLIAGIGLVLIVLGWKIVLGVGLVGILTVIGMSWISMAIGNAMGGPERMCRLALGRFCATRHAGLAILIATHNFPNRVVAQSVVGCTIVAILGLLATQAILRKKQYAV